MIQILFILLILINIFLIYWLISGKKINIGSYVLLLYIFSLVSSFVLDQKNKVYSFSASFYFLAMVLFFIMPLLKFNSNKIYRIKPINVKQFNFVASIFIILGIAAYAYFIPVIIQLFFSGKSILYLRTALVGGEVYHDVNILYYLVTLGCQFYPIVLIFYFYSITHTKNSKLFNRLLLFSSTGYIINVLAGIGRDGFVLWTMSYIFSYILFRNFLDSYQKARTKKNLYSLAIIFSLFFIPITIARFLKNDDPSTVLISIFDYFGQQFGNFNNLFNHVSYQLEGVSKIFPLLEIFNGNSNLNDLSLLERRDAYLYAFNIDVNVFSTFIGSLFLYFNSTLFFLLAAFNCFVLICIFFNNKIISFGKILLIVLFAQVPLHGVFYYKLNYLVSNIYMILVIILAILFYKKVTINFNNK